MSKFTAAMIGVVALTGAIPALTVPAAAQHHRTEHHAAIRHGHGHFHRSCFWQVRHHHRVQVCR